MFNKRQDRPKNWPVRLMALNEKKGKEMITRFVTLFVLMLLAVSTPLKAETDPLAAPEMKKNAKPAVELGWKYFEKGDYETAMKRFKMAIRHDKDFAPGYYGVAYVYSVQGKLDEAIKYYRETIKRDQSYPYSYANLGYALLQKNQFDEALKMLDKALQIYPKCGEAHLSYANYYAYKRQWKKAEESASKALQYGQKIDPEFRKLLVSNGAKLK